MSSLVTSSVTAATAAVVVMPNTDITSTIVNNNSSRNKSNKNIVLNTGLYSSSSNNQIYNDRVGIVKHYSNSYYVYNDSHLYIPIVNDQIIGIIEDKLSDHYKVCIGSCTYAYLGKLAFEGATKKNKPELKKGDVVYCRVVYADKALDSQLSCISSSGVKKEWSTCESIYGNMVDGLIVKVSISYCKLLLLPTHILLNTLGKYICYEIAVGMNGFVWIKCSDVKHMIVLRNAIINAQYLDDVKTVAMIEYMMRK